MGADNPRVGVSGAPLGRDGNQDTEAVRNHEGGLSPSTRPPVSLCQSLCLRSCPSPVSAHLLTFTSPTVFSASVGVCVAGGGGKGANGPTMWL